MSEPFIAEIRIVGFNFAPRGWALCDGQILPINQNQSLYSLLGTTYGGDGRSTFALPDLRGRAPIHAGNGHKQGERGGAETHTLSKDEMPQHKHTLRASSLESDQAAPTGNALSQVTIAKSYTQPGSNMVAMNPSAVSSAGDGKPFDIVQPFLALNFCIALRGQFPPRN